MRLSTTTVRVSVAKNQMLEEYSAGTSFHLPILEISRRAWARVPATLPQWARHYLRGYADALWERLYSANAEFRYQMPDGEWVNAHALTSEQLRLANDAPSATFWRGTDKPF